jgi:hypothetical protein
MKPSYKFLTSPPAQYSLFPSEDGDKERDPSSPDRFQLKDGTEVWIDWLNQACTYGGMLEGYPSLRLNELLVESRIDAVQERYGCKLHVIDPIVRERPEKSPPGRDPWVELPRIECVAQLGSRSVGEFGSRLVLLWYQPQFAMPILDYVLRRIHSLNWADTAESIDDF